MEIAWASLTLPALFDTLQQNLWKNVIRVIGFIKGAESNSPDCS